MVSASSPGISPELRKKFLDGEVDLPEGYLDSFNIIIARHNAKPEAVKKAAQENFEFLAGDNEQKKKYYEREEEQYKNADLNRNGLLNFA